MVRNLAADARGLRGTPTSLTSVMVSRPAGNFDIPLPSRLRICGVGDGGEDGASAMCGVGDGGEDGASAISLTCYLCKLHTLIIINSSMNMKQ